MQSAIATQAKPEEPGQLRSGAFKHRKPKNLPSLVANTTDPQSRIRPRPQRRNDRPQLTVLEFGSKTRALHRLQELQALDVLWRFRYPRVGGGSYPWHYALGYTCARLVAAQKAVRPPRPAEHAQHLERLVESPKLRHQLGVNDFFVALIDYAHQYQRSHANHCHVVGLETWRSEAWITDFHGGLVRPDRFGCWAEHNRVIRFYLEYDTGTEPLDRVAAKLKDYDRAQQRATYPVFGVVLFTVATARRERGLRTALARSLACLADSVNVATTARDFGHPDGSAPTCGHPDPRSRRGAPNAAVRPVPSRRHRRRRDHQRSTPPRFPGGAAIGGVAGRAG